MGMGYEKALYQTKNDNNHKGNGYDNKNQNNNNNKGGGNNKKGNGFKNSLAEFLKEPNRIILYDEERIYREMDKDIDTVLEQMNKNLKGYEVSAGGDKKYTKKDKEPRYFLNAFHNVSFLKYIKEWIKENKGEISAADRHSLSSYIAMGFKDSRMYPEIDKDLRDDMFLDIFYTLQRRRVKKVRNLVKRKDKAIEIAMYSMLQPLYTARNVIILLDKHSPNSNKKKIKLLHELYGKKRFDEFMGYCMTNDFKDNALLKKLIKSGLKAPKKQLKVYLREYARAFKKIQRYNDLMLAFKNKKKRWKKKMIKGLVKSDLGFRKAFQFGKKKKRRDYEELRFVTDVVTEEPTKREWRDRDNANKQWRNNRR